MQTHVCVGMIVLIMHHMARLATIFTFFMDMHVKLADEINLLLWQKSICCGCMENSANICTIHLKITCYI